MKKFFTLMCATAMMAGAASAQTIQRFDVAKKADFTEAMTSIATLPAGSTAYVYISGYVDVGTLKSDASGVMQPTLRNIHFIGVNDEETGEQATLSMEMQIPAGNTEADGFSLHYENLKLRQTQGVWGNSKHLMNFKDANKHYIDTLEFVNCELTELCRSLFRGEVNGAGEDYSGAGTLKVFRMENCTMHNGFRQANAMTPIYMAQPVNEMIIKNNTFYDLTYPNGLISFGNVSENAGRQAIKLTFENNTFCSFSRSSLLSFAGGVSSDSEFHIKNNIILQPNWVDDMNGRFGDSKDVHDGTATTEEDPTASNGPLTADELQARIDKGIVLTNLDGGLVQLENNMLFGYKYQNLSDAIDTGDIIPIGDDETEEAEFSSLAMEDVPFAWTDFTDAQSDMFQINIANPAYTAGKNGAPLGDVRNYTDKVITLVKLTVNVEGSKSASVTVTPEKDIYQSGDKVTLTANLKGSLNTFEGWSTGDMDPVLELTIGEEDMVITASFNEIDYLAVWNLDHITSNNVVVTPPAKPNYGDDQAMLDYARFIIPEVADGDDPVEGSYLTGADGAVAYADSKAAIQTRNNKVSGDVRNCYVIQTTTSEFTLSPQGEANKDGHADYLFISLPEGISNGSLNFFVASDNVPYTTYNVETSTNDTDWTLAGSFDMTGKPATNQWFPVSIDLPNTTAATKIRIKGVEESGPCLSDSFKELMEAGTNEVKTEFLFVTEIILKGQLGGIDGISNVANNAQQQSTIYNLMGMKVNADAKGMLIQNGKKYIVK